MRYKWMQAHIGLNFSWMPRQHWMSSIHAQPSYKMILNFWKLIPRHYVLSPKTLELGLTVLGLGGAL